MSEAIGLTLIVLLLAAAGVLCLAIRNWTPQEDMSRVNKLDPPE